MRSVLGRTLCAALLVSRTDGTSHDARVDLGLCQDVTRQLGSGAGVTHESGHGHCGVRERRGAGHLDRRMFRVHTPDSSIIPASTAIPFRALPLPPRYPPTLLGPTSGEARAVASGRSSFLRRTL